MSASARLSVVLALCAAAPIASASQSLPWDGLYFGINLGSASGGPCGHWALEGAAASASVASEALDTYCAHGSAFVGGLQVGDDVQFKRLVVGLEAELDYWAKRRIEQSIKAAGPEPPAGTYSFSAEQDPSGFLLIAPRLGYAAGPFLPYLKAGALVPFGARDSALFYTPEGAATSRASFSGTKSFSSAGWVAGAGIELGLNGAWTVRAEYLRASLGGASSALSGCSGAAAACAPLAGLSLENDHGSDTAHLVRIGFTYYFDFWQI